MADLDFGEIRLYPGSYDDYMTASTMVTEQLQADNARKQAKITELVLPMPFGPIIAIRSPTCTIRSNCLNNVCS
jgi:hypothetical protein